MSNRWATSTRASRLPGNWKRLRLDALRRDGYRCTWEWFSRGEAVRCDEEATEVDHRVAGDDHSLGNLQSLCHDHHDRKTRREGAAQRKKNREEISKRFRRETEKHPAPPAGSQYVPPFKKWAA